MGISLKQNSDGSMGLQGSQLDDGGFLTVSAEWTASSVDKSFFVADRPYVVKAVRARVTAAGTDAGAVTAAVKKAPSGTAVASGTALHSGTVNLKGTANTNQTITLSTTASDLALAAGDCLGLDFTGVLTAATGAVTITMAPL